MKWCRFTLTHQAHELEAAATVESNSFALKVPITQLTLILYFLPFFVLFYFFYFFIQITEQGLPLSSGGKFDLLKKKIPSIWGH